MPSLSQEDDAFKTRREDDEEKRPETPIIIATSLTGRGSQESRQVSLFIVKSESTHVLKKEKEEEETFDKTRSLTASCVDFPLITE